MAYEVTAYINLVIRYSDIGDFQDRSSLIMFKFDEIQS